MTASASRSLWAVVFAGIAVTLSVWATADAMNSDSRPLAVNLTIAKPEVRIGSRIAAFIDFVNGSDSPIVVNLALHTFGDCELRFEARDPSGSRMIPNVILAGRRLKPYNSRDFEKIALRGKYRLEIRLNDWFDFREPGTYELKVAYWNKYQGVWLGAPVWTGTTAISPSSRLNVTAQ